MTMLRSWMLARLVNGPAHGQIVRIRVAQKTEVYRVLCKLVCSECYPGWAGFDFGYLIAKYRFSGLSSTEWDGSVPVMLYGFVRIEV